MSTTDASFAGHCPRCGGQLEIATFAEHFDKNGKVLGVEKDLVCRRCRLRWCDFNLDYEEEVRKD